MTVTMQIYKHTYQQPTMWNGQKQKKSIPGNHKEKC